MIGQWLVTDWWGRLTWVAWRALWQESASVSRLLPHMQHRSVSSVSWSVSAPLAMVSLSPVLFTVGMVLGKFSWRPTKNSWVTLLGLVESDWSVVMIGSEWLVTTWYCHWPPVSPDHAMCWDLSRVCTVTPPCCSPLSWVSATQPAAWLVMIDQWLVALPHCLCCLWTPLYEVDHHPLHLLHWPSAPLLTWHWLVTDWSILWLVTD